jgi:hypothetical protein
VESTPFEHAVSDPPEQEAQYSSNGQDGFELAHSEN